VPYVLVDDATGRIVAELQNAEQALRLLEHVSRHDSELHDSLCVVRLEESPGSVVSVSRSTTFRVPPELPGAPEVPDLGL
jgi:hypothetical protein